MEFLDIVDKNGNYTGEFFEREEVHKKNLLHNEISIFVINDKKEVLLEKRSANKKTNPNKWGTVAGHVNNGETCFQAALRELEEEIGLKVLEKELIPLLDKILIEDENNFHFRYCYYVNCNLKEESFVLQKEEVSTVRWVSIDDLIKRVKSHDDTLTIKEDRLKYLEELKKM